ncbi:MAG: GNAT family N-acetyltransferase [Actinomycetes bacterium]
MKIQRIAPHRADLVLAASHLFDTAPRDAWTRQFLQKDGHHLLIAHVDEHPAGFVTGIEVSHPDKALEMMLYELGVDSAYRRRGVGRALVDGLVTVARETGCVGMWVPVEARNDTAVAFYRACGAEEPEPAATLWWDLA